MTSDSCRDGHAHASPLRRVHYLVNSSERRLTRRPRVCRYLAPSAIGQKIIALGERAVTQPRDVYDLHHLWVGFPTALGAADISPDDVSRAIEQLLALTWEQYDALVGSYLEPTSVATEGTQSFWNEIQTFVYERLEALR